MFRLWDSYGMINDTFPNKDDIYQFIHEHCSIKNFHIYYLRHVLLEKDSVMIDYGSYGHFFYYEELPESK